MTLPLFISFLLLATPVFATVTDPTININNGTQRVFIQYKSGHHDACQRSLRRDTRMYDPTSATRMIYDFDGLDAFVMEVASSEELRALQDDPLVVQVYEDAPRYEQILPQSVRPHHAPLRSFQQEIPYGVEMVQAPQAWRHGIRGAGVKVCVIDSGTDLDHEDLDPSKVDGSQERPSWASWFQQGATTEWYQDELGHGTHVAGTIAAIDNGVGVVGVAPEAEIFTVKFFTDDSGLAFASSLVDAAFQCRDAGANIISMSLGGPIWNPFEFWVFQRLYQENNILSFAAAGNDGGQRPEYPASYNMVTSVAAVDKNRRQADFSQYNSRVDLTAPGVDILSLLPKGNCLICQETGATNGYGTISGTSMATPHVAGVAALLWSFKPEASANEILQAMEQSAADLGDAGRDDKHGYGLVQAMDALELLNGGSLGSPLVTQQVMAAMSVPVDQDVTDSGRDGSSTFHVEVMDLDGIPNLPDGIIPQLTCDPGQALFDLTIKTDSYSTETKWEVLSGDETVLRVSSFEDNWTHRWQKCLVDSCYTLIISDSEDDGLCCDWGEGSFTVSYDGTEVASGGEFTSSVTVDMGACGGTSFNAPPNVDPDPVDDTVSCVEIELALSTDKYPGETSFTLTDTMALDGSDGVIWIESEFEANTGYQYSACVDPRGCYEFNLRDSFADGLCCEYGFGGFVLSYDGEILESEPSFGELFRAELGEGCTSIQRNSSP